MQRIFEIQIYPKFWEWKTSHYLKLIMYFVFYFVIFSVKMRLFHFEIKCIISSSKYLDSWNKIMYCIFYRKIEFLHNFAAWNKHAHVIQFYSENRNNAWIAMTVRNLAESVNNVKHVQNSRHTRIVTCTRFACTRALWLNECSLTKPLLMHYITGIKDGGNIQKCENSRDAQRNFFLQLFFNLRYNLESPGVWAAIRRYSVKQAFWERITDVQRLFVMLKKHSLCSNASDPYSELKYCIIS